MSLQEAYCYESDVIESAEQAYRKLHVEKKNLHYFCVESACATRVTAKCRLDTFYFAAAFNEQPHENSCQFDQRSKGQPAEKNNRGDGSTPTYTPTYPSILSNNLISNENIRKWNENNPPALDEIRAMIQNAENSNISVMGTLNQIVNTYCYMRDNKVYMLNWNLKIHNNESNYLEAFKWIKPLHENSNNVLNENIWSNHIVVLNCSMRESNKYPGCLEAYSKYKINKKSLYLFINKKETSASFVDYHNDTKNSKGYSYITLFVNGICPIEENKFYKFDTKGIDIKSHFTFIPQLQIS